MTIAISLDKAKYLAREINETVHAGSSEHMRLNTMIANAPMLGKDSVPLNSLYGKGLLIDLFRFYDDVGMLEGDHA